MQTVRFDHHLSDYLGDCHLCDQPGDLSGAYVRAEVAERLLAACNAVLDEDNGAQGYGGLYERLSELRGICRKAVAAADPAPVLGDRNPNP